MSAILFGSISTVADTSELQRQAFNQAFRTHGLDWNWEREQYRTMLAKSGGKNRIADYAASVGQTVDAEAVHRTKSEIFQDSLSTAALNPRAGVVDTIRDAKKSGWKVGLVTTTSSDNITALLDALAAEIDRDDFDVIVDSSDVESPKPDRAAYSFAIKRLGENPDGCVAIEDNTDGIQAARAAGVPCVAFLNQNTAEQDASAAERSLDRLDAGELQQIAAGE